MATNHISTFKTLLIGMRDLVYNFNVVANSITQFYQRLFDKPLTAKIKLPSRKTIYNVEREKFYCPAIHPKTGERGKRSARVYLNLLQSGHYKSDKSVVEAMLDNLLWCGAKIVTSRKRSLEGALMALALKHLESSGARIESLAIGDSKFSREDILARAEELILAYNVQLEAGIINEAESPRKVSLSDDMLL